MSVKPSSNGYFVKLPQEVMDTPAYRTLRPPARALLLEFLLIYRPNRNGDLSISVEDAQERIHAGEVVTARAFYELAERGLIKLEGYENYSQRKARVWSITFKNKGLKLPTYEYRNWKPGDILFDRPRPKRLR